MKNEILDSLNNRKSVRVYEDRPIDEDARKAIINSALQAPTAGNMTLYSIIDVCDATKKEKLAVLCDNQPFIAKSPFTLVFVADWQRWYDSMKLVYGEDIRKPALGDLWLAMMDAVIAAQNCVVAAESLGIGSCYIGDIIENCEDVRGLLGLPEYTVPAAMLCFGYPTGQQKDRPKPPRFPAELICHRDSYRSFSREELERLYKAREGKDFESEVEGMYKRKWSQDFMLEMTRSMELWIKSFM